MSGTIITYSGYCHPLPPDISTTTQPKISTVCLSTSERVKISSKAPSEKKCWIQEGHEFIVFKKREREREIERRKKKFPWSLAKIMQKRSSIKWPKNISEVWVHFSISPEHLWFHKIGIWSSTYLLQTTLQLGNTGNQGMSHSSYP